MLDRNEPLTKLWGIDDEKISEQLSLEKNLVEIDRKLQKLLDGKSFAGSYVFTYFNRINIYVSDPSKIDDIENSHEMKPYDKYLYFEDVTNSFDDLMSLFIKIIESAKNFKPKNVIIFTDILENNNSVYINKDDRNVPFLNDIKQYRPIIRLLEVDQSNLDNGIRSGDYIYNDDGSRCSAGFWAKDKNNSQTNYIVTAGHCYRENRENIFSLRPLNSEEHSYIIGPMLYHNGAPTDAALIYLKNQVKPFAVIKNLDSKKHPELYITDYSTQIPSYGTHLCKHGSTTFTTCGYVIGLNGVYMVNDELLTNMIISNALCEKGDSGGIVFHFLNLNKVSIDGIVTAKSGDLFLVLLLDQQMILKLTPFPFDTIIILCSYRILDFNNECTSTSKMYKWGEIAFLNRKK
ncbi:S1 family peptidase [Gigaspora margarita]|uniref:S1 family peptidase n=1 Tax=Gigaspora margarita TaxID=4874 RepID=A0A8H3X0H4_GIGMA|nr:S1 family peptidase [Gigaspora margarita]